MKYTVAQKYDHMPGNTDNWVPTWEKIVFPGIEIVIIMGIYTICYLNSIFII